MCVTNSTLVHKVLGVPQCFIREAVKVPVTGDMARIVSESFEHAMIIPNLNGVTNSAVVARDL